MNNLNTYAYATNSKVEKEIQLSSNTYSIEFWNKLMRGIHPAEDKISSGKSKNGMFELPMDSTHEYQAALMKESFFRNIASCVDAPRSDSTIWASDSMDASEWVEEGGRLNITNATDDFSRMEIKCNKLVTLTTLNNDFVSDLGFNVKKYMIPRFAECFNRAEENAFINGTGVYMPIGTLHETDGAEVGVTTSDIAFDDVINLYMSIKAKYRKKGVWIMNDKTALAFRKLKDADGSYIWNHNTDTILGKPVYISEFMPNAEAGKKPIAFGDFSYYWIVNRSGIAVRTLDEKFALEQKTGYLAQEFLDARLIRPEAIKVLQIS
jgi:HK97 family phage major capsid protein